MDGKESKFTMEGPITENTLPLALAFREDRGFETELSVNI